tara:strand:- start:2600 stop:2710 length:111 start_codon:yes stop_codon:yes gene_type:complete
MGGAIMTDIQYWVIVGLLLVIIAGGAVNNKLAKERK